MSEILGLVETMVEMSEDKFNECVEWMEQAETSERVKNLIDSLIITARKERQKKRQSAIA